MATHFLPEYQMTPDFKIFLNTQSEEFKDPGISKSSHRPLAVNIVFLFEELEDERDDEGGGDVRVVVSGPWAGDTAMWRPELGGEGRQKLGVAEQGILRTGGKGPSDISDGSGTLTVLTNVDEERSVPG